MRPRVALLEVSHWHVPLYLPPLLEGAEVVAVSDRDPSTAERIARTFGARASADWHAALATPGLDLVFVFGRHAEMVTIARAVIGRRLPFVIEKPGGLSAAEVSEVAALARRAGVPATVPLVQRFGPLADVLRRVGTPDHLAFRFLAGPPSRYPRAGSGWMLDPAVAGGGCLINLGSHFIDLFRMLTDEPVTGVVGRAYQRAHGLPVEDYAVVLLETPSKRSALVEVGYLFPDSPLKRESSYFAAGPGGFVAVSSDGTTLVTEAGGDSRREQIDTDSDPLYPTFVRRVLSTLEGGFAGLPTLADLEAAMGVIDRAYADARLG